MPYNDFTTMWNIEQGTRPYFMETWIIRHRFVLILERNPHRVRRWLSRMHLSLTQVILIEKHKWENQTNTLIVCRWKQLSAGYHWRFCSRRRRYNLIRGWNRRRQRPANDALAQPVRPIGEDSISNHVGRRREWKWGWLRSINEIHWCSIRRRYI